MDNSLKDLISRLNLEPHPEGGYFRETYRSSGQIPLENLADSYSGNRNYATSIYFLLTSDDFSAFHRINQDEIWHFYDGSPIKLHIISNDGAYSSQLIGIDVRNGQRPQFVVKGGSWFAAEVENENSYTLIGCTVSPGFSFDDFELASRNKLIKMFPEHKKVICSLTRN